MKAYRNIATIILFILCIAICMTSFVACNNIEGSDESVRKLYYLGLEYDKDTLTATAIIGFSGSEEQKIDGITAKWTSNDYIIDTWYKGSQSTIEINPNAIFSAIEKKVSQDDLNHDGIQYNSLKVSLRYDTIYKSIKSNALVKQSGKYYLHYFELDKGKQEDVLSLSTVNQRSENWYGLLIGLAVGVALISLIVYLAIKGGKWQKMKKE